MVSIEDVAQRAGVSVATVSRALRGLPNVAAKTRLRVQTAARDLDYVSDPSAARLAAGRTHTLGFVVPSLGTWYGSRMMAAVHDVWSTAGYDLLALVISDQHDRERFLRDLPFRKRVDGLLLMDVPFSEQEYMRLLGTDVAMVTTGARSTRIPSVGVDDRDGARAVVDHLVQLGHREIAVLSGDLHQPFNWAGPTDRLAGVQDAFDAAGIALPDERIVTTDWSLSAGVAGTEQLLAGGRPSAIVCFSDELAIAAMGVLRRRGLGVPRDVSVVGFDDHDLAEHVDLTTVHQPVDTLGRKAASLLLRQFADVDEHVRREVLPTRLVVRESTAEPRSTATTVTPPVIATDRTPSAEPTRSPAPRS